MITIKNIEKSFNNKKVLKDVSFELKEGKCYGLFGNNGAGKTTLTKIIFNELKASSGEINLSGKQQRGIDFSNWYFFVENNELPATISVITYIELQANVKNISNSKIKKAIEKFKPILDIESIKNMLIKNISAGQKKLVSLFVMFLVKPKYIFFDEPTANLDIKNKDLILDFIKTSMTHDSIFVVITHLIQEVSSIVDHIIILDSGMITYDDVYDKKSDIKKIFKEHTKEEITAKQVLESS
ncbi:ABC transporter ATP-binding protein [Mesoplasma chauliocola]|uniref:ABC transporter ATP-binding protein n=1 Tax=Mesoplasma chauliocola TaxID=216427 RepID=A0A249SNI8_9MOLU|nr:ABC transporter ATP-binding protein [Mesoplasma chauliocola]ASZ09196.1 ABC transporter ATP-binding protein [Mesoplasma chauliocola]